MRIFLLTMCTMFAAYELSAQIPLPYSVDFSGGIPSNWEQEATDTIMWGTSSFGSDTPGSAIVDMSDGSSRGTSNIATPPLDLTTTTNPVLRFTVSFIRNNFMAPAISIWYDRGNGWEALDNWGEGGLADLSWPNHTVDAGSDYVPPLDQENIVWVPLTADLSALKDEKNIRFAFRAEFPNGGWVLLDDVLFTTSGTSGVADYNSGTTLSLVPNPANSTLTIATGHSFARIELFDLLGRNLLTQEAGTGGNQLDISRLPAGSYWLQLVNRDGTICAREQFVKQ